MMNGQEDEVFDFGTRKGSRDKVTYRQVLYNVIMQYLNSYGQFNSKIAVQKIIRATNFDEPGMKLRTNIKKIGQELKQEKIERWEQYRNQYGRFKYNQRATQSKLKIEMHKWYWDELFDRILQVLADNQLIVDHNKLQKIRMKRYLNDDDEQFIEESTEDPYH